MSLLLVTYSGPAADIAVPERFPVASAKRKEAAKAIDKAVVDRRKTGALTAREEHQLRKDIAEKSAPKIIDRSPAWKGGGMALRRGSWLVTADELKYLKDHAASTYALLHVHGETAHANLSKRKTRKARMTAEERAEARRAVTKAVAPVASPKSSRRRGRAAEDS